MDENLIEKQNGNFANTVLGAVPSVVYNEDCVEGLKRFSDNYFDLAIVDPPYGVITEQIGFKTMKNTREANKWDIKPSKEYWQELFRVSKNQIIWGFQYFMEELPSCKSIIIWDKMNGDNFMNDAELAWNSGKGNNKIFKHAYIGRYNPEPKRIHPTQKPTALYDWLLHHYAKPNDLILDTHMGSGSSRIACQKGGLNFTGFEIDKDYYEAQEKRFKDFVSQLRMF